MSGDIRPYGSIEIPRAGAYQGPDDPRVRLRREETGVRRALTLTQPWASLTMLKRPDGYAWKRWETRSWQLRYRGWVAIHAAKGFPRWAVETAHTPQFRTVLAAAGVESPRQLPLGKLLGAVFLEGDQCEPAASVVERLALAGEDAEIAFGNYDRLDAESGRERFAIRLNEATPLETPIAARGALGLWALATNLEAEVVRQTRKF